jgi:U3 small nucleolar RNA-associated protein 18
MQSVFFNDMPIFTARYLNDSKEIICTGKRKHYYIYDVNTGKSNRCPGITTHFEEIKSLERVFVGENNFAFGSLDGYLLMYDIVSKSFMYDLKVNGTINSVCFSKTNYFFVVGDQSEIYIFDQRKHKKCLKKFADVGNFNTAAMAISPNSNFLATSKN